VVALQGRGRVIISYNLGRSIAHAITGEALPDEEVEDLRAEYQSLGTISVQVWRKQHLGIRLAESHTNSTKIGGPDPVPEKALKGRALSVAAR
jgi:hypothetical protein